MREARINRKTKETDIKLYLNLDGTGQSDIETGIGFLDHMLDLFAFHSGFDVEILADGDLDVDDHHTVEDIGIALGQALKQALGDKRGIARYGNCRLVMDESLAQTDLDFSGRPYLVFGADFSRENVGKLSTEMVQEFLRALAFNSGLTLHVMVPYGTNDHHKIEAIFKSMARAMKQAVKVEGDQVPSSKGVLE